MDNTTYNIPEGYIRKRRISIYIFFVTIYVLGMYTSLTKFENYVIDFQNVPLVRASLIMLVSEVSLFYLVRTKYYYKGIVMYNADNIKIFTKMIWAALILPIIIAIYMNPMPMLGYMVFTMFIYLITRINNNTFSLERENAGRYYGTFENKRKRKKHNTKKYKMKIKRVIE